MGSSRVSSSRPGRLNLAVSLVTLVVGAVLVSSQPAEAQYDFGVDTTRHSKGKSPRQDELRRAGTSSITNDFSKGGKNEELVGPSRLFRSLLEKGELLSQGSSATNNDLNEPGSSCVRKCQQTHYTTASRERCIQKECYDVNGSLDATSETSRLEQCLRNECADLDGEEFYRCYFTACRFVSPRERRWGDRVHSCIASHCDGTSGGSRVGCILSKCHNGR